MAKFWIKDTGADPEINESRWLDAFASFLYNEHCHIANEVGIYQSVCGNTLRGVWGHVLPGKF